MVWLCERLGLQRRRPEVPGDRAHSLQAVTPKLRRVLTRHRSAWGVLSFHVALLVGQALSWSNIGSKIVQKQPTSSPNTVCRNNFIARLRAGYESSDSRLILLRRVCRQPRT